MSDIEKELRSKYIIPNPAISAWPRDHVYDDIIMLPHHVSTKHPHMSMIQRAAQFSPFQALTGYGDAIEETARITDDFIELDSEVISEINDNLQQIQLKLEKGTRPEVKVTYFKPDSQKDGGAYIDKKGIVKKIDTIGKLVIFTDRSVIPLNYIIDIQIKEA